MAVRMVYLKDKEAVKMGCRETERTQHRCDKRCLWLEGMCPTVVSGNRFWVLPFTWNKV